MDVRLIKDNSEMLIMVSVDSELSSVWIDTYCNRCNRNSKSDKDHSYCVSLTTVSPVDQDCPIVYSITAEQLGLERFDGVYIVTGRPVSSDGRKCSKIVYSNDILYCMRYHMMKTYCEPCKDIKQVERLNLLLFRELMFKEAVTMNRIDDALYFFGEILRLTGEFCKTCISSEEAKVCLCANGECLNVRVG